MVKRSEQPVRKRRTRDEVLVTAVVQEIRHSATNDLLRKRGVQECELDAVGSEIVELTTQLESLKLRRRKLEISIDAITRVVESR